MRKVRTIRISPVPALPVTCALIMSGAGAAQAQSAAERQAWYQWCAQQGGHIQVTSSNPICVPRETSSSGPSFSSGQQALLGLAGQLGNALGNAIRENMERAQREAAIRRMETAWQENRARQFAVTEQARLAEANRQRNEALLAQMRGAIRGSELTIARVETRPLQLRTRNDMFGAASNGSGPAEQEVAVRGPIEPGGAPAEVAGRAVDPSGPDRARAIWDEYLASLQRRNATLAQQSAAETRREATQRVVEEAQRQVEVRRAEQTNAQPSASGTDDRLAEAERLLAQATTLNDDATRALQEARAEAERARQALERAQRGVGAPTAARP